MKLYVFLIYEILVRLICLQTGTFLIKRNNCFRKKCFQNKLMMPRMCLDNFIIPLKKRHFLITNRYYEEDMEMLYAKVKI